MLANIWILSEKAENLPELCAGARQYGQKVSAVVIGSAADAEQASGAGPDQVYYWPRGATDLFEDFTAPVSALLLAEQPDALFVRDSRRARALAGRIAARMGTAIMANLESCALVEGKLLVEALMFGGAAVRAQKATGLAMLMIGGGFFAAEAAGGKAPVAVQESKPVSSGATLVERRQVETEKVNLGAAKQVVGVGRGLARQDDLALIGDLARALGAEIGCTRPVAEGENWMAKERYIGVTGAMIKPDVYWAFGVSGQVQHMVGVAGARVIVAVNKDKNAPIFKQCDYGLIGDLYKVAPALTNILQKS
ncbi:MAG: FAD-binding protein [Gracilibacteraceae bacterium]|jgi:electron transfer flavoprotein alpha subunit|nr:FAD-binding protein [Gracilibacteraceae bacterium]